MPVTPEQVAPGSFFVTAGDELRFVVSITPDDNQGERVNWRGKSALIPNRPFANGPTLANPPLMQTFCNACDHLLSAEEIRDYRNRNIILQDE